MLESMYVKIVDDNSDMLVCDYYVDRLDNSIDYFKSEPQGNRPIDIINSLFLGMHAGLWSKLIKSKHFLDYGVSFPDNLNYQEDLYILLAILPKMEFISYSPIAYYHYCDNPQALSYNLSLSNMLATRITLLDNIRKDFHYYVSSWQYMVFEVTIAYSMLMNKCMTDVSFRNYFSTIKPKVLKEKSTFKKSLCVLMVVNGICSQSLIHKIRAAYK